MTICPSVILGEVIGGGEQTSSSLVRQIMMNELMGIPPLSANCVDVKDCSLAHVKAIEVAEAANHRFILSLRGN